VRAGGHFPVRARCRRHQRGAGIRAMTPASSERTSYVASASARVEAARAGDRRSILDAKTTRSPSAHRALPTHPPCPQRRFDLFAEEHRVPLLKDVHASRDTRDGLGDGRGDRRRSPGDRYEKTEHARHTAPGEAKEIQTVGERLSTSSIMKDSSRQWKHRGEPFEHMAHVRRRRGPIAHPRGVRVPQPTESMRLPPCATFSICKSG